MLSRKHLTSQSLPDSGQNHTRWWQEDASKISEVAGLLHGIIANDEEFRDLAVDWLVSSNGGGVGEPIGIRRALAVVLAKDQMVLKGLLEKSFVQFGDKIWIRHTPIMRQEGWLLELPFISVFDPSYLTGDTQWCGDFNSLHTSKYHSVLFVTLLYVIPRKIHAHIFLK